MKQEELDAINASFEDIGAQVYGKYQFCTRWEGNGLYYADSDFTHPGGFGKPKRGALPAPQQMTPEQTAKAKEIWKQAKKPSLWKRLFG